MVPSRRNVLCSTLAAISGCIAAPTSSDQETPTPASLAGTPNAAIDPVLMELIEATDRAETAADNGLYYEEGRVRVVVVLKPGATLPQDHDLVIEHTASLENGSAVQAMVPVDRLRSLAREPGVRLVSRPQSARPARDQ